MTIATALGLLNLLALGAVFLWCRHTRERDRRVLREALGALAVSVGHQTTEFGRQAVTLANEVRAVAGLPAAPVPPPPTSGTRAAEPEPDVQERPTVEMGCYGRDSAEELTAVVDTSGGVITNDTRRKLVRLARTAKGGAK